MPKAFVIQMRNLLDNREANNGTTFTFAGSLSGNSLGLKATVDTITFVQVPSSGTNSPHS